MTPPKSKSKVMRENKRSNSYNVSLHNNGKVRLYLIGSTMEIKTTKAARKSHKNRDKTKCVVCGDRRNLTKHHLFPKIYYIGLKQKEWQEISVTNIITVCRLCHDHYEVYAERVKEKIESAAGHDGKMVARIRGMKRTKHPCYNVGDIVARYGCDLSPAWLENIQKDIESYHNRHKDFIESFKTKKELIEFVYFWRKHFKDVMQPMFLPEDWRIKVFQ